jgi:DNA-directed RNA polymerase specialized sigma24 family protein
VGDSTQRVIAASSRGEATTRDAAAFVALVEPVLPAAYRLAVAMLRSKPDAEDAVQEAMAKAWRHFERFRPGADMKPWLLAIVANECRRQRRTRWWSVIKSGDGLQIRPHGGAVPDARQTDLRFEEVAQVMKTTTKAAKSRAYRALDRLRLSPEVLADE